MLRCSSAETTVGSRRGGFYGAFDLDLSTRFVDSSSLVIPGSDDTLADRAAKMKGRHAWVRCPVHGDRDASSKLWRGRAGVLRMRCYAGCGEFIDGDSGDQGHGGLGIDIDDLVDAIVGPVTEKPDLEKEAAEFAAEREATRVADAKLGLEPARERVRKTLEAADRLAPEQVEAARLCCTVARGWVHTIRDRWLEDGMKGNDEPCGWLQGLRHAGNGRGRVHYRGCGGFSCPECGPVRVARKAAAVLYMPIVASSDDGDEVVGASMIERGAYLFVTDAKGLVAFRSRYSRASKKANVTDGSSGADGTVTSGERAHSWVAFHQGTAIAVLCTLSLPGRGQPAPTFIPGGTDPAAVATFEAVVRGLVLQTYRVEAGEDGLPPVVVGKVTSSQGLTLDPRKVATLAAGSRWVVEAHKVKGHKTVRETLETMNIGFTERQREDTSLPSTITTAPLTAEQAEAFWNAIRVEEDEPRFQVVKSDPNPDIAIPEPPDLDGLLDDILAACSVSPTRPTDGLDQLAPAPTTQVSGDLGDSVDDDLNHPVFEDGVGQTCPHHIQNAGEQVFEAGLGMAPAALVDDHEVKTVDPGVPDQPADHALHDPPPPFDGEVVKCEDQGIGLADDVEGGRVHDHRAR